MSRSFIGSKVGSRRSGFSFSRYRTRHHRGCYGLLSKDIKREKVE